MTLSNSGKNISHPPRTQDPEPGESLLLSPQNARRILCRATGGDIGRTTFYRWLNSGQVYALRIGKRFLIPYSVLEALIKKCREGERS